MPIARPESRAYRAVAWLVRHLMFAVSKPEWTGTENLPRTGGFIAAANHATELDALTFAHFLYDQGYEPRILAKRGLFTTPVIGSLLRATRMIPVDRGTTEAGRSLEDARAQLEGGACVAIFPEGTLTRDPDLWPMEGKTGLARLALATRQPVVPIAQWGAGDILARYARVPHLIGRKRVQVRVGAPVDLSDLYDRPTDAAALREATSRVMGAITRELEVIRGEQAPAARFDLRLHPEHKKKQTTYPPVERP
ncbi:lysophospholipid acyltransferase family protein [Xylanimonas protaetiae]|uniref:1-acyl-sn-glycerol-3-phosphate acyltransferase n=1 Tax=Xylanimonas protaetiae TaxID=2509457 RepID=A0A4P6F6H3_9MICO|nr:lysophospholipid acyltransferase family protein [Xylanimonas protaetiae]QAY71580.1 1-acyl-sn-glycerol-3-phosphate acyltransferase [Xylanimonas protaetiae]